MTPFKFSDIKLIPILTPPESSAERRPLPELVESLEDRLPLLGGAGVKLDVSRANYPEIAAPVTSAPEKITVLAPATSSELAKMAVAEASKQLADLQQEPDVDGLKAWINAIHDETKAEDTE